MRNIYITFIFIGVISLGLGETFDVNRPFPQECTSVQDTPTGCQQCEQIPPQFEDDEEEKKQFQCKTAAVGYYIDVDENNTNIVLPCDRNCMSCNIAGCLECRTDGFVDTVGTVKKCDECKAGYTGDLAKSVVVEPICISVAENGPDTCAKDYVWGSKPNANRKCVPNPGKCQTGYVTNKNSTDSTENCIQCEDGYKSLTGVAVNGNTQRYNVQTCVKYVAPAKRPTNPVQCEATGKVKTDQCKECDEGICKEAEQGFYVKEGKVSACPSQCLTCDNGNSCQSCVYGTLNEQSNCDCGDKKTPNIDQSLLTSPSVEFICISYEEGADCAAGNNWNAPAILIDSTKQKCLSNYNTGSCYQDPEGANNPGFDQTSYWNAPINQITAGGRQCQPNQNGKCLTNYKQGGSDQTVNIENCYACDGTNTQIYGAWKNPNNQEVYNSFICTTQTQPVFRQIPKQCADGIDSTDGCKKCNGATCEAANPGYFIVEAPKSSRLRNLNNNFGAEAVGSVQPCLSQCAECSNGLECTSCERTGYIDKVEKGNCECAEDYTPSISIELTKTVTNEFLCIQQSSSDCSEKYTWDSGAILQTSVVGTISKCINILTGTCYNSSQLVQGENYTSVWDSTPNQDRLCVQASKSNCVQYYAQADGRTTAPLTSDCTSCITGYKISNDNSNQICIQGYSGLISISFVLLGLLFSLLF